MLLSVWYYLLFVVFVLQCWEAQESGGTKRATSAPAELGGEIQSVSRNRARTQVLLQAWKLRVYGSGTFGAFWGVVCGALRERRIMSR